MNAKSIRLALRASVLIAALACASAKAETQAPDVVASIKPIHSLVSAVMEGAGTPSLIVEGAGSPHTYSMRPSQASALEKADVVFWVGPGLEHFLQKPLSALAGNAAVIELDEVEGVTHLPLREGGMFEPEADEDHEGGDEHEHHHHDHGSFDPHVWLDPQNAQAMLAGIGDALAKADPAHAKLYAANVDKESAALDALADRIGERLKPVRGKPYIVFHDAYHYFEDRFSVPATGSITISPEVMPGAARLAAVRDKIATLNAACVFAEPEFEPKFLRIVTEGTNARTAVLDPLGADIADGPDLYPTLVERLAADLAGCLSGRAAD